MDSLNLTRKNVVEEYIEKFYKNLIDEKKDIIKVRLYSAPV